MHAFRVHHNFKIHTAHLEEGKRPSHRHTVATCDRPNARGPECPTDGSRGQKLLLPVRDRWRNPAVIAGSRGADLVRHRAKVVISLPEKPKLDSMNAALAKKGIYNVLTQKKITALADIRNSAAHGKWDGFESSDVDDMLRWTNDFMQKHFS